MQCVQEKVNVKAQTVHVMIIVAIKNCDFYFSDCCPLSCCHGNPHKRDHKGHVLCGDYDLSVICVPIPFSIVFFQVKMTTFVHF